ncbi:unnamed protein product [Paramecium primaurelia]|uniref:IQCH-like ATP-grasp domain-containing protein n=1 Tax=Paramecium primaurelia TaxID=5886 RepID=A0A8S1MK45_PARPR|nr:unnamed protein product [Paramecium primaurelia]
MKQIQDKTYKEFADIKHHIGTLQSQQLSDEELSLLYERLKYQFTNLNQQVAVTQTLKPNGEPQPIHKRQKIKRDKPLIQQQGKSIALPKILKQPSIEQRPKKSKGKLKSAHIYQANVLNRELRLNPFSDLPTILDEDLNKGVSNLIQSGLIPRDVDVGPAFKRGDELLSISQVQVQNPTEKSKYYNTGYSENLSKYKVAPQKQTVKQIADYSSSFVERQSVPKEKQQQTKIVRKAKYIIEIKNGHYVPDFHYQIKNLMIWGGIMHIIKKLEKIASGQLDGDRIAQLAQSQFKVNLIELYECYISKPIMERLYILNKKQFSADSAIVKIQATVRMFVASRKYRHQKRIVQKVIRIQKEFRLKQTYVYTINQIKKNMGQLISTLENRQKQFLLEDLNQKRIEIHIPSYSIKQFQRLSMSHFKNREGLQLTRLFALKDPNVSIIFVCAPLQEEIMAYFYKLLEVAGINAEGRLFFIHPENINRFPQHYSLALLLYLSPKAIHQISELIKGQFSYIIPMRVGREEFLIAEYLKTNIYSGPYELIEKYSKKSEAIELFRQLSFPVAPEYHKFVSKDDFVDKLTVLIMKNLTVQKWMFKIDIEFNGRGTAWFSLEGVKQFIEIKKFPHSIEFKVLRELVQTLLPIKTVLAFPQMFTFEEYLDNFIKNGGIVEAYPNAQKVQTINIQVNLENQGTYQILNTSTSIVIKEMSKVGCIYPQNVLNLNVDSLIQPLAEELYKQNIFGYFTLSLLSFNGAFYTKSLKFGLDEYIGATILATAMETDQFTYIPFVYHPGIAEQKFNDLFIKCRKEGISFDIEKKVGTLIWLSDQIEKGVLSLLCLGAPKKAVKLTTDALNFLQQFGGNIMKTNSHQKQDTFYFIDIVSRLRQLNSEGQQ